MTFLRIVFRGILVSNALSVLPKRWLITCAALVVYMQAGFAMLEAGCCREGFVSSVLEKNLLDACHGERLRSQFFLKSGGTENLSILGVKLTFCLLTVPSLSL